MPNNLNLQDALLKMSHALAASPGAVHTAGIDLGNSQFGDFVAEAQVAVTAPALSLAQLPNADVVTYIVEHDTDPAFGTATTLLTAGTQTGASSAGAAGATYISRLPVTVKRYIRGTFTTGSGAGDCSAASASIQVNV